MENTAQEPTELESHLRMHRVPVLSARQQAHLEVMTGVVVGVEEDDVAGARDVEAGAAGHGADEKHERRILGGVEPDNGRRRGVRHRQACRNLFCSLALGFKGYDFQP